MAQPGTPPPPIVPPAGPPQVPPPYYPGYYPQPPPRSTTNTAILVILIVVVIAVVGTIVLAAILYVLVSGLTPGPGGSRPIVTFSPPTLQGAVAILRIAGVTSSAPFDLFRANLVVNATAGTPTPVSPSFTITVGTESYPVTFIDADGNGLLSQSDEFRVTAPAGWRPGITYRFDLLWTDLSQIAAVSWTG